MFYEGNTYIPIKRDEAREAQAFSTAARLEGNTIYVTNGTPLWFIRYYVHEVGHYLGFALSFTEGDVLSPREVIETTLPVTKKEIKLLHSLVRSGDHSIDSPHSRHSYLVKMRPTLRFANLALEIYSKGKFVPGELNDVVIQPITQLEIDERSKKNLAPTTEINKDGILIAQDSRNGRNCEIPSIGTEHACLTIIENTIKIINPYFILPRVNYDPTPYKRAQNIIRYIYKHPDNYCVPSTLDFEK